jgi:polyvinyl alcohol dehydrogenase (cytochrome)
MTRFLAGSSLGLALLVSMFTGVASAQEGEAVFNKLCVNCHKDGSPTQAPLPDVLRKMSADSILDALENGKMKAISQGLSPAERQAVAKFLGTAEAETIPQSAYCTSEGTIDPKASSWMGYGIDLENTRYQTNGGLAASSVPNLKLKWAFGFPGATTAFGHPSVFGGRVLIGSQHGQVFSLDQKTGCIHWIHQATEGVRTGFVMSPDNKTVYFGDLHAYIIALNFETGKEIWKTQIDNHALAIVTGTPKLVNGTLYAPLSGGEEEVNAGNPDYKCCTLRGAMVALNAADGKILWKTYTVDEPKLLGKTAMGTEMWGPNGASPWTSPTVDTKTGRLYVGTGVNYSEPATKYSDSLLAFDMKSGKIAWSKQLLANDVYNFGCLAEKPEQQTNCPKNKGVNMDIGVSPILRTLPNGKRILLVGMKNGMTFGLDPDKKGEIVWQTRVSPGGLQGGIIWGSAADEKSVYYSISDWTPPKPEVGGGVVSIDIATGKVNWRTPAPKPACLGTKGCSAGQPGAVALIPGAVFATSLDGHIRAYDTTDGKIIWDYDTLRDFDTVNGIKAHGGSMNGTGPSVAGGMLFTNSGYSRNPVMPGNAFLAFSAE